MALVTDAAEATAEVQAAPVSSDSTPVFVAKYTCPALPKAGRAAARPKSMRLTGAPWPAWWVAPSRALSAAGSVTAR